MYHSVRRLLARQLWKRILAMMLILPLPGVAMADMAQILERGRMHVATEDMFPPFNFISNGQPDGFQKDLLVDFRAFAKEKAGIEVDQEVLPWTGLLAAISAGRYDLGWTGTAVTEERVSTAFNFSPPFLALRTHLLVRKDDDSMKDIASLSGKVFAVQTGGAELAWLPELEAAIKATGGTFSEVVQYPSPAEASTDLANGRIDAVITANITAIQIASANPDRFALGIPVMKPNFVAWPVPKASPELLKFMTEFMDHIRANGRLAELQDKWFGLDMGELPTEPITSPEALRAMVDKY